ncbi:hypothetical protein AAVH_38271, partial [Aphelenchoides avenae]
ILGKVLVLEKVCIPDWDIFTLRSMRLSHGSDALQPATGHRKRTEFTNNAKPVKDCLARIYDALLKKSRIFSPPDA